MSNNMLTVAPAPVAPRPLSLTPAWPFPVSCQKCFEDFWSAARWERFDQWARAAEEENGPRHPRTAWDIASKHYQDLHQRHVASTA